MQKKVLIITYYWPPSGGAGVQRWLKFAKYLRQFGWEPVIYTPENPEAPAFDTSLLKDVPEGIEIVKTKVWEPYSYYKKLVGLKKSDKIKSGFLSESKKPSFVEKLAVWIRGNFFIPDARRFWIKPSVKFLLKYLDKHPVDAIISTGPPHSMHLIALGVKKKSDIPWLADFRDPWTNIDFYHHLKLTRFANRKHHKLESEVIRNATKLVTVSWNWANDFRELGAKDVEVVTNGYDPDDFRNYNPQKSDRFEIMHIGSLNTDRNPGVLWETIAELTTRNEQFDKLLKIVLIGQTDYRIIEELKRLDIFKYVDNKDYLPHSEIEKIAGKTSLLLLPLNNTPNVSGRIPGKIFEYLALNKPILCIGPPNGDSARIIKTCSAGKVVDFDDKARMEDVLIGFFEDFKSGEIEKFSNRNIRDFSRELLTGRIAEILDEIG